MRQVKVVLSYVSRVRSRMNDHLSRKTAGVPCHAPWHPPPMTPVRLDANAAAVQDLLTSKPFNCCHFPSYHSLPGLYHSNIPTLHHVPDEAAHRRADVPRSPEP